MQNRSLRARRYNHNICVADRGFGRHRFASDFFGELFCVISCTTPDTNFLEMPNESQRFTVTARLDAAPENREDARIFRRQKFRRHRRDSPPSASR